MPKQLQWKGGSFCEHQKSNCDKKPRSQVCTLQLDESTGLLDEKDLVQRLQKIQSLKPSCNLNELQAWVYVCVHPTPLAECKQKCLVIEVPGIVGIQVLEATGRSVNK